MISGIYQISSMKLILFFSIFFYIFIVSSIAGNTFVAIVTYLLYILKRQVPDEEFLIQRARICCGFFLSLFMCSEGRGGAEEPKLDFLEP